MNELPPTILKRLSELLPEIEGGYYDFNHDKWHEAFGIYKEYLTDDRNQSIGCAACRRAVLRAIKSVL